MICPKCGEKYEDDMPRCLWCDAPNPDHAAVMERLRAEEKAEQFTLHDNLEELKETSVTAFHEIKNALNEKPSIVLTENFKEKSMEAMPKKRSDLYIRILVWVSEFMVGFTAFEIVRKINSLV